jgi:hypothetical protein
MNTFQALGYGAEPSGHGFVGDVEALAENGADTVFSMNNAKRRKAGPGQTAFPFPFQLYSCRFILDTETLE